MAGQRRPRTPHYVTERKKVDRGGNEKQHQEAAASTASGDDIILKNNHNKKKKSLRAGPASNQNNNNGDSVDDDPTSFSKQKNLDRIHDLEPKRGGAGDGGGNIDRGYIRLRNERLERMEQPLIASEHWRDIFSGDPDLGKPSSSTLSGPWQVSAFALLGLVVVLSAIFLHMVAENNNHHSDHNNNHGQSPYNTYRRRQRHARRMYKTRKKKTDEWSDDEEDLILQNSAGLIPDHAVSGGAAAASGAASGGVRPSQSGDGADDTQYYPYYYDQDASDAAAAAAALPGYTAQEHRQRRRSNSTATNEPNTPPTASGSRGTYYMPVNNNPTYKSPSANLMMNLNGVHRRGISPGNSFNSNKSSGRSPGPALRVTTAIGGGAGGAGYSSGSSHHHHTPSPSHIMRATAPLSGRLRVPSTPDGKDLFPSISHSHSMHSSSGSHGIHHVPTLPTPPEEGQLHVSTDEAQIYGGSSTNNNQVLSMHGGGTTRHHHELGARPLNSSNFSSFASMDGSGDEHAQQHQHLSSSQLGNRSRGGSHDTPLSASLHLDELLTHPQYSSSSRGSHNHDTSQNHNFSHPAALSLQESHHQSLLLSPGNYEAATPQIGNVRRKILSPEKVDFSDFAMPDMNAAALMPPGGGGDQSHNHMPFIPALNFSQHRSSRLDDDSPPLLYAAMRPPRSVLLDELRIVQMETGNSTHWAVQQDVSDSQDPSESPSFEGDDVAMAADHADDDNLFQGGTGATFEEDDLSEEGSDIPIPSGDPRGGIKHKRDDLTTDTNAYKSLQSNIEFEEIKLEEVIGGGGFGQVWRGTWFGTPVAVKVLTGSAQNQHIAKAILEEFKAEINLLKGMRHPNICLYMGACVRPPNRAIVTELAANGSVWDALRLPLSPPYVPADGTARGSWPLALYVPGQHGAPPSDAGGGGGGTPNSNSRVSAPIPPKGTWPWQLVKRVASGAARGMAYLHHGNPPVLHRDLKSANLLLDDSYTAKVCDFGLSRLKAQSRSMTGNCGTVQWMAPEVLANMSYDEKADIFSYGIILWELLSRECPYEGMTAIQCALAVLNRDKRPEIPKWCPPSFHALIKSCVKKDPAERPSFSQIILALDAMEA